MIRPRLVSWEGHIRRRLPDPPLSLNGAAKRAAAWAVRPSAPASNPADSPKPLCRKRQCHSCHDTQATAEVVTADRHHLRSKLPDAPFDETTDDVPKRVVDEASQEMVSIMRQSAYSIGADDGPVGQRPSQFTTSFARNSGVTISFSTLPLRQTHSTTVGPGACSLKSTSQAGGQLGNR